MEDARLDKSSARLETVDGEGRIPDDEVDARAIDLLRRYLEEARTDGESSVPDSFVDPEDDWGFFAADALTKLDATTRMAWESVLDHATTANAPRPSGAWLREARRRMSAIGDETFRELVVECLGLLNRPTRNATYDSARGFVPSTIVAERNATLLKGLIWCGALIADDPLASAIGDAAISCFKKIPNFGARSTKAGNACLYALGAMSGMRGLIQLQRLRQRVKYAAALKLIDSTLDRAAEKAGLSRDDLADLAVPTFDLQNGRLRSALGSFVAEIEVVTAHEVNLRWWTSDGSLRRAEPVEVKRDHPEALKSIKQTMGEIRKILPVQRDRVERLLIADREWTVADWRQRYLDHPLVSVLARRLIWQFDGRGRSGLGAWHDGAIVDVDDRRLEWVNDDTSVRPWHPLGSDPAVVLAWRQWIERHGITQPFRQAHREVYLLTDAERGTRVYSSRFAAHVLRQHQLQALAQQRGWRFQLQGYFDRPSTPELDLPRWSLRATFSVYSSETGGPVTSGAGIFLYVSTDRVAFSRLGTGELVPLVEVPPRVFSEVMRDVDLFVGVCSIGNDPTWLDRGTGTYQDYWQHFSFGELSQAAQVRRTVLERVIPRLKIASRCSLDERFLVVRGDLGTYRIHLGSGNILMERGSRYLCIVPGRGIGQAGSFGRVFLPFEGDDTLSIILSKAFLLANDASIKDPSIVRQIRA